MATSKNLKIELSLGDDEATWLESLAATLRPKGKNDADRQIELYLEALAKRPNLKEEVRSSALRFLLARNPRSLMCEAGIASGHSLLSSLSSRLLGKVLPPPPRPDSLQDAVRQAFHSHADATWLSDLTDADLEGLAQVFRFPADDPILVKMRAELGTSLEFLSTRLAAMGLDSELLGSAPELGKYENPFLSQSHEVSHILQALGLRTPSESTVAVGETSAARPLDVKSLDNHLIVLLTQCSEIVSKVQRQVKKKGTSLYLTYHLVTVESIIERMQLLSGLLTLRLSQLEMWRFFVNLCVAENRRHSVGDLIRRHWRAIALQIVRQAGHTGGHYIAQTRPQLKRIFRAAVGAGFVIAIMALIKIDIAALHMPPVLQSICYCGDYALGFVLIHMMGFTVATKQPAMTAAALAAAIPDGNRVKLPELDGVADLCVKTARTQAVAITGNIILAFPTAFLLSWLWETYFSYPFVSPEKAHHLLEDLAPYPALIYAAVAGVGLYLSGIISGYFDNLSDYYSIPDRIRNSPTLRYLLKKRVNVWARVAQKETGAIAGNTAFGIYLGLMSGMQATLGIPLDIRHVSFSAANFAYALRGRYVPWEDIALGWLAIASIGIVNLTVSFGLALVTAASARGIGRKSALRLSKALWRKFREPRVEPVEMTVKPPPPERPPARVDEWPEGM